MPFTYPAAMRRLINELSKLPSIGERSATRLAYHLLTQGADQSHLLADAIRDAISETQFCAICHFLSDAETCTVCQDERRDPAMLCVVEKPADVFAIERSGGFRGLYHVLHGVWSPLRGVRPEQTKMRELLSRLTAPVEQDPISTPITELILATSATVDGEATALYIAREVEELGVLVSRIGQGLPKGGELEYADEMTLTMSFQGRREI